MPKKIISSLLILAMVMGLISGCVSNNQEDSAIAGELVEQDQTEKFDQEEEPQKPFVENEEKTEDDVVEEKKEENDKEQTPSSDDKDEPTPERDEPIPDEPVSGNEDVSEEPEPEEDPEPIDPEAEDSGWYKIASYNIKSMWYDPKTRQTGADQRNKIVQILRAIDADIVGLQEVDNNSRRSYNINQAQWLAGELGYEYYHFTKTTTKDGGDYGHAILSRFPIKWVDEVTFREQTGSEPRKYSKTILEIDGKEVVFNNVHLCTQQKLSDGSRDSTFGQAQFREVCGVFQNEKRPALMTGDFNLPLQTQFKLYDRGKVTSMNGGKTQKKIHYGVSIDNIYVNNLLEYYVDETEMSVFVGKETASDHDPVWSYFKIT